MDDSALGAVATAWHRGDATAVDVGTTMLRSTVFCQSRATPGLVAWGPPGAGVIGVFSDLAELAIACGAVPWVSTTGADLMARWPRGYDVGLDVASAHAMRLPSGWLASMAALVTA
jgi:hypothetical protein